MTSALDPKGPGHDQRRCRFLIPNPGYDRSSIPYGAEKGRLALFLCLYKGADHPLITTMVKCRYCRTTGLWFQPRDDIPDAQTIPVIGTQASKCK